MEDDDTIRLNPPRQGVRRRRWLPIGFGLVLAAALGVAGARWGMRWAEPPTEIASVTPPNPPPRALPDVPPPVVVAQPAPLPLAGEAAILADSPEQLAVYRFAPRPDIVVLQFPTLAEQGRTLNRVAALIEKSGFPRDRVTDQATLDAAIRAAGETPDTFYYGHDYSAAALRRFFALAPAASLNEDEKRLQALMGRLGWAEEGQGGALISLVRQTSDAALDPAGRATILEHELSHGFYFTDPAYAAFVRQFWEQALTSAERTQFTAWLGGEGYDPAISDLMINEMQAYLMFTPDPRFFSARLVGLSDSRVEALRRRFLAEMPPGWLHDRAAPAALAVQPVRAPRRRRQGRVDRTMTALLATRPRRAAASRAGRSSRR